MGMAGADVGHKTRDLDINHGLAEEVVEEDYTVVDALWGVIEVAWPGVECYILEGMFLV